MRWLIGIPDHALHWIVTGVCVRLLVAALWVALPLAGAGEHRIESWTTDNGLPIGHVHRVLQTRDG